MLALPSISNLIISTFVFILAAWYFHRHFEAQSIPKGLPRTLLVFVLAYFVSWGAGEMVDWVQGPQAELQTAPDVSRLLTSIGQLQP